MKALSIIGIIFSCIGCLASMAFMTATYYNEGARYPDHSTNAFGFFAFLISAYLLAFSIVALVNRVKSKTKIEQPQAVYKTPVTPQ